MIAGLNKLDDQYVPLQIKVFTRWVQNNLQDVKGVEVNDITKDLSNGVALVELAQILTKKPAPRNWVRQPERSVDMVQNCELALNMFTNDGVRFVNMSGKDIKDNNEKLCLGLIWTLILHYQIGKVVPGNTDGVQSKGTNISDARKEQELYSWAVERTSSYSNIQNCQPYDLSMCALLDSYVPDKINYNELDPNNSEENAKLATKTMEELGIPVYVYPDELQENNNS